MVIFRLFDNRNIIIKKLQPWKDCEMKVIRWALVSPHSDFAIIHNNSGHSSLVHLPLTLQRETHSHMVTVTATKTISNQQQHPDTTSKPLTTPSSSPSLKSAVTPSISRCGEVQGRFKFYIRNCEFFLACLWRSQADFKINVRSHLDVIISLHSYEAGGHLL